MSSSGLDDVSASVVSSFGLLSCQCVSCRHPALLTCQRVSTSVVVALRCLHVVSFLIFMVWPLPATVTAAAAADVAAAAAPLPGNSALNGDAFKRRQSTYYCLADELIHVNYCADCCRYHCTVVRAVCDVSISRFHRNRPNDCHWFAIA